MINIKSVLSKNVDAKSFSREYFRYLSHLLEKVDVNAIAAFIDEIESARKNGNTIFFIGNGGSAATALHMVNDISLGSRQDDEDQPLRSLALTDNVSVITALANDCGYDHIFVRQLKTLYRPGDKLVAISVSGNSPNILAAVEWVKKQKGVVIGMVGFDGGKLKGMCDIAIDAKGVKGEYGPVEDIHTIIGHLVYTWLWYNKRTVS